MYLCTDKLTYRLVVFEHCTKIYLIQMFNMPLHVHTLSIFSISTPCTNAYSAQIWIFHVLKFLINLKVDITRSEKYFSF